MPEPADSILAALAPHQFVVVEPKVPADGVDVMLLLARKTWNTNRGVAVVRLPKGAEAGPYAQSIKMALGKAIGYFTFFYGLGLQVVLLSDDPPPAAKELERYVDAIDNQRCIIQSIYVVDANTRKTTSGRTWGQIITGKFQDAIVQALATS